MKKSISDIMENIEKDIVRDIAVLDKLKKEEEQNYNQILSKIRRRKNVRIFLRIVSPCAAVLVLGLLLNYVFDGGVQENNLIAEKFDTINIPTLITESGEKIALKNDNSYKLEYPESPAEAKESHPDGNVQQSLKENEDVRENSKKSVVSRNTVIIPNGYTYDIKFDDGTTAHINSGSYIEYPRSFANREERIVSLTGEGYFKVTKSEKPFIVKVGGLEVKVYGTEFNLNTNKENRVEVILVNGSVGVKKEGENGEIMLNPNQMLVYNVKTYEAHTQIVEPSDYLGWMKGDFTCSNQSMFDLMDEICAFYGITINKDASLADKMITISLSRQLGFRQIMEIMEPAFGLEFIQNGKMEFTCRKSDN
ncbi:MAG: FecR family protein [Bacteroidales bacterium]|nr:FecR family protein [Bacteroidales bacterium]